NAAQRAREATIVRNYANALPANSYFVYCGDMNLYTSSEAAYTVFTGSQTDNDGRAFDPLPAGSWNNNASFAPIHTQSPRVRQFGGGSDGGMDDRFDFLLPSLAFNNTTGTRYLTGTMIAFGNDGNHFNDSINSRPNTAVPDSIADALHYGSDHIPVVADFLFVRPGSIALLRPNGGEEYLINRTDTIRWSSSGITGNVRIELNRNYPTGTWETLFANIANDGIELWNPTAPVSSSARVRIVSVINSVFADTSLSAFTIQPIPVLYQSATSVAFSARKPHTTDSTTLVIANVSNIAFRYATLTGANGGAFSRTVLDNDSTTPPNDSLRIRIRFTPDSILTYRDTLQITFESPYQTVIIPLSGSGIGYYLSLSETALTYPNLLATNTRDSLTTVLRVQGNTSVTNGRVVSLSGQFSASLSQLPTMQPGDSLTIQLFYQPNQQGNHNGEIAIISDAVSEDTLRIALTGRASDVPRAPANLTATKSGISIQLQWSRVDSSTLGNPIVVDGYTLLYRHNIASTWEPLEYFLHPDSTSYLHYGAANSGSGFYSVVAWIEQPNPEVNRLRLTPGMIPLLQETVPPNR
ncbi:MAG: hypothetical protein OEM52_06510, partial [bacterium]|nr:hypothetical protein [bacterium]